VALGKKQACLDREGLVPKNWKIERKTWIEPERYLERESNFHQIEHVE
jgi:hypothetical protein